eukprot:Ihof_evm5s22 gene=Ihof_evmTU5s22
MTSAQSSPKLGNLATPLMGRLPNRSTVPQVRNSHYVGRETSYLLYNTKGSESVSLVSSLEETNYSSRRYLPEQAVQGGISHVDTTLDRNDPIIPPDIKSMTNNDIDDSSYMNSSAEDYKMSPPPTPPAPELVALITRTSHVSIQPSDDTTLDLDHPLPLRIIFSDTLSITSELQERNKKLLSDLKNIPILSYDELLRKVGKSVTGPQTDETLRRQAFYAKTTGGGEKVMFLGLRISIYRSSPSSDPSVHTLEPWRRLDTGTLWLLRHNATGQWRIAIHGAGLKCMISNHKLVRGMRMVRGTRDTLIWGVPVDIDANEDVVEGANIRVGCLSHDVGRMQEFIDLFETGVAEAMLPPDQRPVIVTQPEATNHPDPTTLLKTQSIKSEWQLKREHALLAKLNDMQTASYDKLMFIVMSRWDYPDRENVSKPALTNKLRIFSKEEDIRRRRFYQEAWETQEQVMFLAIDVGLFRLSSSRDSIGQTKSSWESFGKGTLWLLRNRSTRHWRVIMHGFGFRLVLTNHALVRGMKISRQNLTSLMWVVPQDYSTRGTEELSLGKSSILIRFRKPDMDRLDEFVDLFDTALAEFDHLPALPGYPVVNDVKPVTAKVTLGPSDQKKTFTSDNQSALITKSEGQPQKMPVCDKKNITPIISSSKRSNKIDLSAAQLKEMLLHDKRCREEAAGTSGSMKKIKRDHQDEEETK